jgi:hypothetical protein
VKEIPISDGSFALVDDEDYAALVTRKWYMSTGGYVRRNVHKTKGKNLMISMHREIMNPTEEEHVDHVNGNKRDCQRANLRKCTQQENNRNLRKKVPEKCTSRFKGVCWVANRYRAYIVVDKIQVNLGRHRDEATAAIAYNAAAVKYFGAFANLNEV